MPVETIDAHKHTSSSVSTIDELLEWRINDRTKSVAAGLVLCLNLGIDPPDCIKPSPCACWECWIDPVTGLSVERCGNVPEEGEVSPAGKYKQSKLCSCFKLFYFRRSKTSFARQWTTISFNWSCKCRKDEGNYCTFPSATV